MEGRKSPDDGKKESPSLENIGHLQTMKRDVESLEDFEDLTKDVPSMKDVTAQFLQYETGDKSESRPEESLLQFDHHFVFEPKENDQFDDPFFNAKEFEVKQKAEDDKDSDFLQSMLDSPQKVPDIPKQRNDGSFSNLLDFEQTDFQAKKFDDETTDLLKNEQNTGTQPTLNILNENKLADALSYDEISTGSEDLSFISKKAESSPVLSSDLDKDIPKKPIPEFRPKDSNESFPNMQPLLKFTSEPAMPTKCKPEIMQGDGLHVKENNEGDVSDNEDFIPEPIPKDYPEIGAIEGKQFLAAIGLDTWFHPHLLNPKLESLVYWRDPKKSGIVFGSILVILLSLTSFSLISVVSYTSLTTLGAALAFRIYKSVLQAVQKTSEGHPFKEHLVLIVNHPVITTVFLIIEEYLDIDLTLNPDKARETSDLVVSYVNKALTEFRRLFLVEDVIDSIKFGIILWCLTYVGAWFNGLSLLIIAFVGLFTLPKVYENNKTQIDANIDIVKTKINEVTEKIKAVIPVGKKSEDVKDKNE